MTYKERILKIHGSFRCLLTALTVGTPYCSVHISVSLEYLQYKIISRIKAG